jgi:Uma2 family endonuclease
LIEGQPSIEPPRGALHCLTKGDVAFALKDAVVSSEMPYNVFMDGMAVPIDDRTAYIPDAMIYGGPRFDGDEVLVPDPMIVVEVLSSLPGAVDTGAKLAGYFKIPSVQHYLIVDPTAKLIVHHKRQDDATILTRIVTDGALDLTPPGLSLPLADVFPSP